MNYIIIKNVIPKLTLKDKINLLILNLINKKPYVYPPPLGRWKLKDKPFTEKPGENYPW
jgi:hypothetical protein